jgi:hypothetical protein
MWLAMKKCFYPELMYKLFFYSFNKHFNVVGLPKNYILRRYLFCRHMMKNT